MQQRKKYNIDLEAVVVVGNHPSHDDDDLIILDDKDNNKYAHDTSRHCRRQRMCRYVCDRTNIKRNTSRRIILTTIVVGFLFLLLRMFVFHPYAWVYRRCLVAHTRAMLFYDSTLSHQIACQEARTHQLANTNPILLWPPTLEEAYARLSSTQIQNMHFVETQLRQQLATTTTVVNAVRNIHYTITAPFSNPHVRTLGLCNLEAMTKFCADDSFTSNSRRINLWIVDRAASAFHTEIQQWSTKQQQQIDATRTPILSYLLEMITLMERVFSAASSGSNSNNNNKMPNCHYCIRVIHDTLSYQDENPIQSFLQILSGHQWRTMHGNKSIPVKFHHCPPSNFRSRTAGRRLREWLNTSSIPWQDTMIQKMQPTLAESMPQLIPEHSSDAWRLVALLEWGGLYLDLDVIPFSPRLMQLPCETVPTQHRIGAYRVNGGVLRLGDRAICSSQPDDGDDSKNVTSPGCLLKALEADHLFWAPRLARLSEEDQTFGFLGPGALTRVVISRTCRHEPVTVLPHDVIEPVIDATICDGIQRKKTTLAAHFSRSRKTEWWSLVTRYPCLEMKVRSVCPETTGNIEESS